MRRLSLGAWGSPALTLLISSFPMLSSETSIRPRISAMPDWASLRTWTGTTGLVVPKQTLPSELTNRLSVGAPAEMVKGSAFPFVTSTMLNWGASHSRSNARERPPRLASSRIPVVSFAKTCKLRSATALWLRFLDFRLVRRQAIDSAK